MSQIEELLLKAPVTGESLEICTPIQSESDGAYSFCVIGKSGQKWRHTIKTEEVTATPAEKSQGVQTLAGELKRFRLLKAQTLREVGTTTGISNCYLSQLENGKATEPSPRILRKLADHYEAPYTRLMYLAGYLD